MNQPKPKRDKREPLGSTLPVRMEPSIQEKLVAISDKTGLNLSAVLRLAVRQGLPLLEAGKITAA